MNKEAHIVMVLDNPFISDMRVKKEASSLVKNGFKVSIVCMQDEGLDENDEMDGIEILRLLDYRIFHPLRSGFKKYVEEIAHKIIAIQPSVIHCHDYYTLEFGAKVKAIESSTYLTYDSHEYFRKWLVYQDISGVWNRFKGYLVWRALVRKEAKHIQMCNAVITAATGISNALKEDHKLNIQPITVRNIPSLKRNAEHTETIRSLLGIPEDHLVMVQSGNMYQSDREIHQMIDEALEVPDLHFVFIGNRARHYEIHEQVKKAKKDERVHLIEFDESVLYNLLESADFGVLFMKTDVWISHLITVPNRIMEYSLVGIPFLSVEQVTSREIDEKFGTVDFFDLRKKGSFTEAIKNMIANLPARTESAQKIAPSLSWESEYKTVVTLYKAILKDS